MNIALPALVLLLGFIPGQIFFYTYNGRVAPFDDDIVGGPTFNRTFAVALFFDVVVHTALYFLSSWILPVSPNYSFLLYLVAGDYSDGQLMALAGLHIEPFIANIAAYLVGSIFAGYYLGRNLRRWVLKGGYDLKYGIFRFSNDWHYLFVPPEPDEDSPYDLDTLVIATISYTSSTYLYAGFLDDYIVGNDGRLRELRLLAARRRKLSADRADANHDDGGVVGGRFYPLTGEILILDATNIQSLVIDFVWTADLDTLDSIPGLEAADLIDLDLVDLMEEEEPSDEGSNTAP